MANPNERHPDVAESGDALLQKKHKDRVGPPTNIICPECGGSLWELKEHNLMHYQCHVGHSFTADSLLGGKDSELERR